ncbi:MAG: hypothetical protein MJ076_05040 [Clostridia bacterium]|nr:hypothetical protein [Clostridia bacterium]
MKKIFDFNLRKLLYNKKFTIPLSLILSFAIWLVIMINQNPVREQIFTDITASVSIENTVASEMGLGIVSDVTSQKFTVTVSGPNYIVSSLKPEDFLLSASVTDVNAAGTYSLEILGTRNSSKSGYSFVSITPSTIDVTFDYIDTKEFTVVPKLTGVGATEGLIAQTPVVSNSEQSTITIKGPRSVVQQIESVNAVAKVDDTLNATQTYDADIVIVGANDKTLYRYSADGKIYNSSDEEIQSNNLTLSFTSVKVTQPISKKATVKVNATFSNVPSGITVGEGDWSIDHNTVSIIGTPSVVDSISEISLPPIDWRSVSSSSSSFEVSPKLPDGVKIFDNIDYFTVTVNTKGYTERVFTVTDIRYSGLASSLNAKTGRSIKNVKICGPSDVIKSLKATDLYAVIDLTDKSAGQHNIEAVIKSDKYNNIWQNGTYNATVTITD